MLSEDADQCNCQPVNVELDATIKTSIDEEKGRNGEGKSDLG